MQYRATNAQPDAQLDVQLDAELYKCKAWQYRA